MSLRDLFLIFSKNDYEKDLTKKLSSLESNIEELKKSLLTFQEQKQPQTIEKANDPPIIIEKINIEKIILDKYELNNNFGQLGIKELKGKLNIGATYGSEFTPKMEAENNEIRRKEKNKSPSPEKSPKVNIYAKKDEEMKKD
ncbi:hypothetical protein [Neobacillus ginsengisoli]|uniref:Uncharacterized protein n=1 Tax=Neobacillus ginsengisoli TaxID=904295 RepID=A0ABT9XQD0_9BACI|nr:hypothetical protein [Neobacillus ginsengisoli]MDQ0197739.1 hypothetical protein [Neobacillus ginsengisoli]